MKNIKLVLGLVLVTGLISCSRSLVRSDYDHEVNFARYKTFDWKAQPQNSGSEPLEQYKVIFRTCSVNCCYRLFKCTR